MKINVYARSMRAPWLFDDLKGHFLRAGNAAREVVASEEPVDADAWICIRTRELAASPDPSRTVVQVHDLYGEDYGTGKPREGLEKAGALCFTHPEQPRLIERAGVKIKNAPRVLRPVGALRAFTCRQELPEMFTVGVVGRPILYRGMDVKRLNSICDALIANCRRPMRVIFLGQNLGGYADRMRGHAQEVILHNRSTTPISSYPSIYRQMDCLVTYSVKEAGPMCLFEALSSGVYVVSSRTGWAEEMLEFSGCGKVVDNLSELALAVSLADGNRQAFFGNVDQIVEEFNQDWPYRLEDWVEENLELAERIAK